jgi:hypothetical protein
MDMTGSVCTERLFVVADRFENFAENPAVITVGEVNDRLASGWLGGSGSTVLYPGMGVDDDDWAKLCIVLDEHGDAERVRLAAPPPERVPAASALKDAQQNVLLGNLRDVGPRRFQADLVFSADTEMIKDHTAERQHIPGMLLMEACCQMLGAATERFLSRHQPGRPFYCVMQHFDIDLYNFVFPLPAYLDMTIEEWDGKDENPPFSITIEICQEGTLCARAHWRYRAFRPDRLFKAEALKAKRAIAAQMSVTGEQ